MERYTPQLYMGTAEAQTRLPRPGTDQYFNSSGTKHLAEQLLLKSFTHWMGTSPPRYVEGVWANSTANKVTAEVTVVWDFILVSYFSCSVFLFLKSHSFPLLPCHPPFFFLHVAPRSKHFWTFHFISGSFYLVLTLSPLILLVLIEFLDRSSSFIF